MTVLIGKEVVNRGKSFWYEVNIANNQYNRWLYRNEEK